MVGRDEGREMSPFHDFSMKALIAEDGMPVSAGGPPPPVEAADGQSQKPSSPKIRPDDSQVLVTRARPLNWILLLVWLIFSLLASSISWVVFRLK